MDLIYESMPCQVRPISVRKTEGTGIAHDAGLVKDSPMRAGEEFGEKGMIVKLSMINDHGIIVSR